MQGSTPYSSRSSSRASTPYEPQEQYSATIPSSKNTDDRTRSTTHVLPTLQQFVIAPFPPPHISMAEHQRRQGVGGGELPGGGGPEPAADPYIEEARTRRWRVMPQRKEGITDTEYERDLARNVYFHTNEHYKLRMQADKFLHNEKTNKRNLQWGICGALLGVGDTIVTKLLTNKKKGKSNNLSPYSNIK